MIGFTISHYQILAKPSVFPAEKTLPAKEFSL